MCFIPSRPWNGESGSTEISRTSGFFSRRKRPTPMKVPLVPRPVTKWVIAPPVCSQISGPVVR